MSDVIEQLRILLDRHPACLVGSSIALEAAGLPAYGDDVDVFCYSDTSLISAVQILLNNDYDLGPRDQRVWERWLAFGIGHWRTNSLHVTDPAEGSTINLVFKKQGNNARDSLSSVLESFDFGLLGLGYDLAQPYDYQHRDMRSFLFPRADIEGPLPLMPKRREAWRAGLINQYQGLRQVGRYAKYLRYGFDLSAVKEDLVEGYLQAQEWYSARDSHEHQMLGQLWGGIANSINSYDIQGLSDLAAKLVTIDSLDLLIDGMD